ncbi:pilus assembly PilX family protein [Halovibrio salipaludis]|nr:PilX N-terminal domain-containing pilus assembly protein [Halovibrio salipaludis]
MNKMAGHRRKQGGAALLLALIILFVLTLLGISSLDGALMQNRMAQAQREGVVALELADAALSEVEARIRAGSLGPTDFHDPDDAPDPFDSDTWTGNSTQTIDVEGFESERSPEYRYFIEDLGEAEITGSVASSVRDFRDGNQQSSVDVRRARIVVMARSNHGNGKRLIESFYVYEPDA